MTCRLKEIRKSLGMTQSELSDKSGVTRQTISRIESDPGYNTSANILEALANALGVPVENLFGNQYPTVELTGRLKLIKNGDVFLCENFSSTRGLMELLDQYGNRELHATVSMEIEVVRIPEADSKGGSYEEKNRPRWKGGPPDYMWWLTVILQLIAIALQILATWLRYRL